jgi:hypothetical protein
VVAVEALETAKRRIVVVGVLEAVKRWLVVAIKGVKAT